MALTRNYLKLNGAEISVESEKGKGTAFTIHFSQESEAAARSDPQFEERLQAGAPRATILVVDNDTDTQAYMRAALRQQYNVVIAASAAEARGVLEVR